MHFTRARYLHNYPPIFLERVPPEPSKTRAPTACGAARPRPSAWRVVPTRVHHPPHARPTRRPPRPASAAPAAVCGTCRLHHRHTPPTATGRRQRAAVAAAAAVCTSSARGLTREPRAGLEPGTGGPRGGPLARAVQKGARGPARSPPSGSPTCSSPTARAAPSGWLSRALPSMAEASQRARRLRAVDLPRRVVSRACANRLCVLSLPFLCSSARASETAGEPGGGVSPGSPPGAAGVRGRGEQREGQNEETQLRESSDGSWAILGYRTL